MHNMLVDKMCNHLGCSHAHDFVVSLVSTLELDKDTLYDKLNNSWQLGVNNRNESGIYVSEVWRCHLSFHDCSGEKALASQQVLIKEFQNDVLDV